MSRSGDPEAVDGRDQRPGHNDERKEENSSQQSQLLPYEQVFHRDENAMLNTGQPDGDLHLNLWWYGSTAPAFTRSCKSPGFLFHRVSSRPFAVNLASTNFPGSNPLRAARLGV